MAQDVVKVKRGLGRFLRRPGRSPNLLCSPDMGERLDEDLRFWTRDSLCLGRDPSDDVRGWRSVALGPSDLLFSFEVLSGPPSFLEDSPVLYTVLTRTRSTPCLGFRRREQTSLSTYATGPEPSPSCPRSTEVPGPERFLWRWGWCGFGVPDPFTCRGSIRSDRVPETP